MKNLKTSRNQGASSRGQSPEAQPISPQRVTRSLLQRFNPLVNLQPETLQVQLQNHQRGYLNPIMRTWEAMMRRDDKLASVCPKRFSAVARYGYEVLARDKSSEALRHKEALEYFYNNLLTTDAFRSNLKGGFSMLTRQMSTAKAFGHACHEMLWKPSSQGITAEFRFAPAWFFENLTGRLRFLENDWDYYGSEMDDHGWLITMSENALMEPSCVCYMFKQMALRDWVNFSEKFGFPGILGKTDSAKGSIQWNALVDAVDSFGKDFAGVCSLGDTLELIRPEGGVSAIPFPALVDIMNRAIVIMWRGGDLGTQSHHGGGQGQGASLQGDETEIIEEDDAQWITETLNLNIDRKVIAFACGSDNPLAYVKILTKEKRNPTLDLQAIQVFASMGARIPISATLERFGITEAELDDDVFTQPVASKDPQLPPDAANERTVPLANSKADSKALGKFLASARDRLGKAEATSLGPVRNAIARALQVATEGDERAFANTLAKLKADLPHILRACNATQGTVTAWEEIFATTIANTLLSEIPEIAPIPS